MAPPAQTYGTAASLAGALGTTISTGVNSQTLAISYSSTGDTATADVGTYAISGTASNGSGSQLSDYTVTLESGTLTVNPYAFTYQIGTAAQTYGTAASLAGALGTTISTGVNSQTLAISYSSTGDTATADVGSYAISGTASNGSGSKLSDYTVTLESGALTVNKATLTVITNPQTKDQGQANPPLTGQIEGEVNNDGIYVTWSTNALQNRRCGPYPITATLHDPNNRESNYTIVNSGSTLTIGTPTIPLSGNPSVAEGSATS